MIKNIIFDFGDIFIDLDKSATATALKNYGFTGLSNDLEKLMHAYEKGLLHTDDFVKKTNVIVPKATESQLIAAWNKIILDVPEERLLFLEALAKEKKYRLFLLSNTNALHIEKAIQNMGTSRYERFKNCFEKFYLSHEIHFRKPNVDIYEFVLDTNNLTATESLFIDDTKENTEAAKTLGIHTWNLRVGIEDIMDLNSKIPV
ncbi:HAD family phosphatase [Cellulophaga sp. F20128]|uniref:HAD family hydrolase n=1 Tax=Cellulophaga sp. F20128 TaxID=2926413 RepID=UPI001FF6ACF1|nr:HAD family phosphatase [Cellulophaga sp. F20128]MCK0157196.1 HAD family phosphatase [Cellulophaga sp. F20128]